MSSFEAQDAMVEKNIQSMNELSGFGVVMVCCSGTKQVKLEILKHTRNSIF